MKLLFVSNGHGEQAIAARIAKALQALAPVEIDHLALVGDVPADLGMRAVGPRSTMPSGGLLAMGNIRNILSDIGAGLIAHTLRQCVFLTQSRYKYDATVAVGDIFALLMALRSRCPAVYVGTAKSVHVAPYGWLERKILRSAVRVFVRDEPTAHALLQHGIHAQAPGNVIADFYLDSSPAHRTQIGTKVLILFPGSRQRAYDEAVFLTRVVREVAKTRGDVAALLSIAPGLEAATFADVLRADGWLIRPTLTADISFDALSEGRLVLQGWTGSFSALLRDATLVLGQAGTANEAAAAAGIPVVTFEDDGQRSKDWYRMRQIGLLGDAMHITERNLTRASATVLELLADEERRAHMGQIGQQRMGPPGGARAIANQIVSLIEND
ncbi:MAG: lipid-A-disaccharide synthase-related protein [Candidatus Eremiobacteraeota bacterium]|nr:lipid-A-disaccharide synthase-related protein [Candidatus Eremiobacteraeota bacterium]